MVYCKVGFIKVMANVNKQCFVKVSGGVLCVTMDVLTVCKLKAIVTKVLNNNFFFWKR